MSWKDGRKTVKEGKEEKKKNRRRTGVSRKVSGGIRRLRAGGVCWA